jgi:enterochelin esterase-like enzyme
MRLGLNLLVGLAISACALGPRPGNQATAAASLNTTPIPSPAASTRTPPALSPTTPACLRQPGGVVSDELLDDNLPRSIPFRVYVPPCYEASSGDLPVLVLLHGLLATDQQWLDLGLDGTADGLIARGEVPPFLIVMPWERRGLEFESAVVEHLLPHVQTMYRATQERGRVAIGGLSRGAGWALRIGLKHPDVFGSVGLHSPAVLTPDLFYLPDWVGVMPEDRQPRLWIDIGDHDSLRASVFELNDLLTGLGYEYEWNLDPGDHTPDYWSSHLEAYLRWYSEFW